MPKSSLVFIAHPPAPEQLFNGHYAPGLVALSIALAISAAYTALMVAQFATTQPQSRLRQTFMGLGGLAMGVGVWAMHFIGMLGFELPCPVAYDPWGTGLSIVPGLIASVWALHIVSQPSVNSRTLMVGGFWFGVGIGVMHYAGMGAMRLEGSLRYDPALFLLSLVVAVMLATLALWVRYGLARHLPFGERWTLPAGATVMGLAIAGMHYTAMGATYFMREGHPGQTAVIQGVDPTEMAMGITMAAGLLLGLVILVVTRQMMSELEGKARVEALARELQDNMAAIAASEERFRTLFERSHDAIMLLTTEGVYVDANQRALQLFGLNDKQDLLKRDLWQLTAVLQPDGRHMADAAAFQIDRVMTEGGCAFEWLHRRADGKEFLAEVLLSTYPTQSGKLLLASLRDITQRQALENAARQVTQRLELAKVVAGIGIWDWNLVDNSLEWDDRMCEIYAVTAEEQQSGLLYDCWRSRLHPDDRDQAESRLQQAIRSHGIFDHRFRIVLPGGQIRHIHSAATLEYDASGQPIRMVDINDDITAQHEQEQARTQAARQASEQRLGAVVRQALTGVAEADEQGILWQVNDRYCEIVGRTREELLGHSISGVTHPEDWALQQSLLQKLRVDGLPFVMEKRYRRPNGDWTWGNLSVTRVADDEGRSVRFIGMLVDINQTKQSEERLRMAMEASRMGMFDWNLRTGKITCSREHEALWGFQPGEFDGTFAAFARRVHPDDLAEVEALLNDARDNHRPYTHSYRVIWPDGSVHWLMGRGEFTYAEDGRADVMRGTVMDITALKTTELILQEEQRRLAEAQRIAHLGSWDIDARRGLAWSRETYRIWGVEPESFVPTQKFLLDLVFHEDRPLLEGWLTACRKGEQPPPLMLRRYWPDGRLRYLSIQGELQHDAQGEPLSMTGTVQDVTERHLAERQLRDSEQRFRLLFEHLPIAYQSLDIEGNWLDANPMLAKLLGFERPEDLLGLNFGDFWQDDSADRFPATFDHFKARGFVNGDLTMRRNDGATVVVHVVGYIQRDSDGRFQRTHCVLLDITERQAMEMEILALNADLEAKIQERTAQLQAAMEAKSRFLANMSHEIRTPMNAVLGLAQMLEHEPLTEDQAAMVSRIRSSGRSLLNVINDILDFSKIEAGQFNIEHQPFKLAPVLKQLENLLVVTAGDKGLTLRIEDPNPVEGRIIGDALRLEQILLNLTGNAIKFTETGEIVIRVSPVTVSASTARLRFEVTDSGIGMDSEAMAKLFKPFSQADAGITRRFGGTGLGLSISKRLVELMDGAIGVESNEGVGSTFWFELPFERVEDDPQTAETTDAAVTGPRFLGLHLLVADDNQINRFLAERVLTREGARVTLVNDGLQAVNALRENPEAFDAVLMDIQMPVMDGLAATRAIREELGLTDLPVIALTAAVMPEERQEALAAGVNDFLPKPMELERMITVIRNYCPSELSA